MTNSTKANASYNMNLHTGNQISGSRRKTLKIVNKFRFISFVSLMLIIIVCILTAVTGLAGSFAKDQAPEYITVKVQYGDTLWNLARDYGNPDKDVREIIYDICQLNHISASELQAGQIIEIPCK